MKSAAHSRITRLVECDLKHLNSYYREVKSRVSKVIEKSEVNKIIGIFTKYFVEDEEHFNADAFSEIILFLIDELERVGIKDINIITKLKITTNPFKYLQKTIDFGIFYEQENDELESLRLDFPELKN